MKNWYYEGMKTLREIRHSEIVPGAANKDAADFTEKEKSEGVAIVWAKDLGEAISLLEHDSPEDYGGKFIRERDLAFLKVAKELL